MRLALALLLLSGAAPQFAQAPNPARTVPRRADIAPIEESLFNKLRRFDINAPIDVLGLPRGTYLDGYGAVFTAEVNLLQVAGISPFRPEIGPEEVARVKAAKQKRLPIVRNLMRQMLLDSAASLDRMPMNEQVVLSFILVHHSWEDRRGLPQLITMQATRQTLVDAVTRGLPPASVPLRIAEE